MEWLAMARHGESVGNVAWREAETQRLEEIDIGLRDPDVPLSETGRRQAEALGRRLAAMPPDERPTVVYSSPYVRAAETARIALAELGDLPIRYDERLRDRENGALYALTWRGITARFPEEAARKRLTGKFYYRPPGGESWADVALRLRSVLAEIQGEHPDGRVLVVAHDAVVVLTRYIVERLSEKELLEIERTLVPNASLTLWARKDGELRLVTSNSTEHLDAADLPA
ncbi:histidine phosphatase family protein [Actinoallomurus iriomotensis]|uniref:phosphoglycerate mutase (2,3-diphosphoglycerate-dependent) n=1 Tax=Actinoallomurus iriomotensis TaxID=478107 RepID=A0A9W6RJV1_9ACTN|nr:histidine phosphatase family protein [Actinoallomurus iriomotensis]GLY77119.1 phosphoglycerate mutase [Actinoallomurus iriomotensis]